LQYLMEWALLKINIVKYLCISVKELLSPKHFFVSKF
jgi:hypothetical protein